MKKNELLSQDQLHSGKKDIILNNELLNQLSKKDISLSDDQVSKLLSLSDDLIKISTEIKLY